MANKDWSAVSEVVRRRSGLEYVLEPRHKHHRYFSDNHNQLRLQIYIQYAILNIY